MVSVTITKHDRTALVFVGNPPVNALSSAFRKVLIEAVREVEQDPQIRLAFLAGENGNFIAGADISELGGPAISPTLPEVIDALEGSRVVWVAAIEGFALGGGLEVAMACSHRIATASAMLGLPEVSLGIIPGAGGTVRLPRLVGVSRSVDLVTSGKRFDAAHALSIGLVDQVVDSLEPDRLLALAQEFTERGIRLPRDREFPDRLSADEIAAARARIAARARGQQAPLAAFDAVIYSQSHPAHDAQAHARKTFLELSGGMESKALRYLFTAERNARGTFKPFERTGHDVRTVGVVGGGTMGSGIAAAFLAAGFRVKLVESTDNALQNADQRVRALIEAGGKTGHIHDAEATLSHMTLDGSLDVLADCDLAIEAIYEDFKAKTDLFQALDRIVRPDCVLATNTSYLDVNAIATATARPERVVGLHFFAPANKMKLLEVVRGARTGANAMHVAGVVSKRLGKIPVISGVCEGFIGNRIMSRYRAECDLLLEEGASPAEVDAAMRDFGFAMGIYEVQDMSGLDIAWAMRKRRAASALKPEHASRIPDRLCELGRFGRKAGKGWYSYEGGEQKNDPLVEKIAEEEARRKGITRRRLSRDEIMDRINRCILSEADLILSEGIAATPSDIDMVMVLGFGYPRHRGGPTFRRLNT